MSASSSCLVCEGECLPLGTVDFNKACLAAVGETCAPAGIPVHYVQCERCGFSYAPALAAWPLERFEKEIYNDDYVKFDPDYIEARPAGNAADLHRLFGNSAGNIRHLDYGGGSGLLSSILKKQGWDSSSYDPFVNRDVEVGQLGQFDLVSAFEVFEHVPDVGQLMAHLRTLLAPGGLVMFSTLSSDGHIQRGQPLDWWYASPRNGHISLFSTASLAWLARQNGWQLGSYSAGTHVFFTQLPAWASHIMRTPAAPAIAPAEKSGKLTAWLLRKLNVMLSRW
jgi:SAM-dependent methyltransferase